MDCATIDRLKLPFFFSCCRSHQCVPLLFEHGDDCVKLGASKGDGSPLVSCGKETTMCVRRMHVGKCIPKVLIAFVSLFSVVVSLHNGGKREPGENAGRRFPKRLDGGHLHHRNHDGVGGGRCEHHRTDRWRGCHRFGCGVQRPESHQGLLLRLRYVAREPGSPSIESLGESSVQLKISAKTLPNKHRGFKQEWLKRIKKRFDEQGIEHPYRKHNVRIRPKSIASESMQLFPGRGFAATPRRLALS